MWTKSACVLFALSIVLIMTAAGLKQSARPAQATKRNANSTQVIIVTSTLTAGTPHSTSASTAARTARYVVQPGDTLSGIAASLGLPGGWRALYAANRAAIGPDPNVIHAGTVLGIPGSSVPAHYRVAAGDTLSGIAARLGLPGGWRALYAANRAAIGPDPNAIRTGIVLTVPRPTISGVPVPPASHPGHRAHQPAPRTTHRGRPQQQAPPGTAHPGKRPQQTSPGGPPGNSPYQTSPGGPPGNSPYQTSPGGPQGNSVHQTTPPPGSRHGRTPARAATAPIADGMPDWLTAILVAVGGFVGGAFLLHLFMTVDRWRRKAAMRAFLGHPAPIVGEPDSVAVREPGPATPAAARAGIVLADYDRLIVTHIRTDDTVYVLRPPGEDPKAILRVARLVLAEAPYRDLAEFLGLPASWPIIMADYHRLVVTHSPADNTVCVLRRPGEDPMAVLRAARLVLQEEPYEELASQLGVPASWPLE